MKVTDSHVYFWGGIFSNFYKCEIEYANKLFHSSEQLFMYLKAVHFKDLEIADQILFNGLEPKEAKRLGRQVKNFDNSEWEKVRKKVMLEALTYKFYCNPELEEVLLKYRNKTFVEASPFDKIWGVGLKEDDSRILNESNWEGLNLLGKCLNKLIEQYDRLQ